MGDYITIGMLRAPARAEYNKARDEALRKFIKAGDDARIEYEHYLRCWPDYTMDEEEGKERQADYVNIQHSAELEEACAMALVMAWNKQEGINV